MANRWHRWGRRARRWGKKWFTRGDIGRYDSPDADATMDRMVSWRPDKYKRFWPKALDFLFAVTAAIGTGLATFFGCYGFGCKNDFGDIASYIFAGILGAAGWFANQSVNDVSFEDFHKYARKPNLEEAEFTCQNLKKRKSWVFYFGVLLFVISAAMYGATAFAFGEWGPLQQIAAALGLVSAIVTVIPEVENWIDPYYHKADNVSIFEYISGERKNGWALFLTLLNVIALSATFAIGLVSFFQVFITTLPMTTAIIISIAIAYSIGGATPFYFYLKAITDTFTNFKQTYWPAFRNAPGSTQAKIAMKVTLNAVGNLIATVFAINWILPALVVGTPFAALVGPYLLAFAIVCGLVAGLASFVICSRFCAKELITAQEARAEQDDRYMDFPDGGFPRNASELTSTPKSGTPRATGNPNDPLLPPQGASFNNGYGAGDGDGYPDSDGDRVNESLIATTAPTLATIPKIASTMDTSGDAKILSCVQMTQLNSSTTPAVSSFTPLLCDNTDSKSAADTQPQAASEGAASVSSARAPLEAATLTASPSETIGSDPAPAQISLPVASLDRTAPTPYHSNVNTGEPPSTAVTTQRYVPIMPASLTASLGMFANSTNEASQVCTTSFADSHKKSLTQIMRDSGSGVFTQPPRLVAVEAVQNSDMPSTKNRDRVVAPTSPSLTAGYAHAAAAA